MCVVGVDVGQQRAHDGWHPRTHILGRQAGKVAGGTGMLMRMRSPGCNHTFPSPSLAPKNVFVGGDHTK